MAHHFDHHFRDLLLREPVSRCETELPSPWALRRKIIIKNRKLPPDDTIKHNICDKDDADDKQFQGAINIVDHKGDDYPRYVTLYENGLMQFSTLETSHDDSASSSPPPSPTPPPPVQEEEQDTDTGMLLFTQKFIGYILKLNENSSEKKNLGSMVI